MSPPSGRAAEISSASAQGERSHQEDAAFHAWIDSPSHPDAAGWLLAVFDGHRGAATAQKAVKALPAFFKTSLQASAGSAPEALRETLGALNGLTRTDRSGSTASVAFIPQDARHIHWAVLGDSPVAVLDSHGDIHIGPDHNVRTNIPERAAAESRGGFYQAGYLEDSDLPGTGLQMARCLGDADLARVLSREPEIETLPLGGRGVVLVGTDGLFGAGLGPRQAQLSRLLKMIRQGADAEALVRDAVKRQTGDNVTAVVWKPR